MNPAKNIQAKSLDDQKDKQVRLVAKTLPKCQAHMHQLRHAMLSSTLSETNVHTMPRHAPWPSRRNAAPVSMRPCIQQQCSGRSLCKGNICFLHYGSVSPFGRGFGAFLARAFFSGKHVTRTRFREFLASFFSPQKHAPFQTTALSKLSGSQSRTNVSRLLERWEEIAGGVHGLFSLK